MYLLLNLNYALIIITSRIKEGNLLIYVLFSFIIERFFFEISKIILMNVFITNIYAPIFQIV